MKKAISILLTLALVLSICTLPATAAENTEYLTRGALEELLRTAADDYNGGHTNDIILGYEDSWLRYDANVSRIEALVMMRRAFDTLPSRESNRFWSWIADEGVTYSDVPDWAVQDVDTMIAAGLLANTDDGRMGTGDYLTRTEADQLLRRIWMLYGSNPKDDFFMAKEKRMLEQTEVYPGNTSGGALYDVRYANEKRFDTVLNGVLRGTWPDGSDEQKIKDLYGQALAVYAGEYDDISPIQEYLDALDEADSLNEILDVMYSFNKETGFQAFLDPSIGSDCADNTKNVLWLFMDYSGLELSQYSDSEILKATKTYYETLLRLSGDSAEEAASGADIMIAYKKALAGIQPTPEERYDVDLYYNVISFADADAQLVHLDLGAYLKALGYTVPDSLVIDDLDVFAYLCDFLADKNAKELAYIFKISMLDSSGPLLSHAFIQAQDQYRAALYGEAEPLAAEARARNFVTSKLETEMGKLYVKARFTQEDKDTLLAIEKDFVKVYRERIQALDWMREATKQKAIDKLNAMTFKNVWPDYWFTEEESRYIPVYQVVSQTDGGTLYANAMAINRAWTDQNIAEQGQPVNKEKWLASPLEVNAGYAFYENCVYIFAGILSEPFYQSGAALENTLGSIGAVIGHEITHAFDTAGAKFDLDGNATDWWTREDYDAFSARCTEIEDLFNRFEDAPGIPTSGKLTLGENIADLGGLSACLQVLESQQAQPDYDLFFSSYADTWRALHNRQVIRHTNVTDVHAVDWLRVNVPLMQLEQFYQTYGITEDDGMYLPLEERVRIW